MRKADKRKPTPPRPPRELCSSVFHWAFGIVSPSKLAIKDSAAARKYRMEVCDFQNALFAWKVEKRSVTKSEWKLHHRAVRIPKCEYKGESIGALFYDGFMDGLKAGENEST